MEFGAVLFGNGLTLCYQKQIQSLIPDKYKHALYFDDYIEAIMNNSTNPREKNMLLKMFKPGYNYSFASLFHTNKSSPRSHTCHTEVRKRFLTVLFNDEGVLCLVESDLKEPGI